MSMWLTVGLLLHDPGVLLPSDLPDGTAMLPALMQNRRITLAVRGNAFRSVGTRPGPGHNLEPGTTRSTCEVASRDAQLRATRSLIANVVTPLEAMGNVVDATIPKHFR